MNKPLSLQAKYTKRQYPLNLLFPSSKIIGCSSDGEILDSNIDFDAIIVPIGGGGLISGVASAVKNINPKIDVIGVGASGASALKTAFYKGELVSSPVKTIADGIAVRDSSSITLGYMKKYVDEVVSVDDEEIASAILFLLENQKIVVEGAGAVGVAAILHSKFNFSKSFTKFIARITFYIFFK